MCSRYEIDVEWQDLAGRFGLDDSSKKLAGGEVRPTNKTLTIGSGGVSQTLRWGIPAPWEQGAGKALINARSETLAQKKSFRPLLESRCLIPASAYFEWRRDGKNRLKNRIRRADGDLMGFAGLLTDNHFTIITCDVIASLAHIHNRMPVILPEAAQGEWLDLTRPFGEVSHWLIPYEVGDLFATEETPTQPDLFS